MSEALAVVPCVIGTGSGGLFAVAGAAKKGRAPSMLPLAAASQSTDIGLV